MSVPHKKAALPHLFLCIFTHFFRYRSRGCIIKVLLVIVCFIIIISFFFPMFFLENSASRLFFFLSVRIYY